MADFADLTISIKTLGAEEAKKALDNIAKAGDVAERSLSKTQASINKSLSSFGGFKLGSNIESEIRKVMKSYSDLYKTMEQIGKSGGLRSSGKEWIAKQKAELDQFPKYLKGLIADMNKAMSQGFMDKGMLSGKFAEMTANFKQAGEKARKVLGDVINASIYGKSTSRVGRDTATSLSAAGVISGIAGAQTAGGSLREYAQAREELKKFNEESLKMKQHLGEMLNKDKSRDDVERLREYNKEQKTNINQQDQFYKNQQKIYDTSEKAYASLTKQEKARLNKEKEIEKAWGARSKQAGTDTATVEAQKEAMWAGKTRGEKQQKLAVDKATNREIKEHYSMLDAQKTRDDVANENTNKRFKALKDHLKGIGEESKTVGTHIKSWGGDVSNWVKGLAKGLGVYLSLYGAGLLLRRAFESWVSLIREGIEQIDDLRTQIIESSAMMTSLSDSWKPTAEVYGAWEEYFNWLFRASLAADRKFAASGKEIFKVAQETAFRGVVATTTEQVDTLGRLTDTIKMVTKGIGHQEWQIYQEIRNLFLGSEARLMGAQLLQRLKQIDPNVQKTISKLQQLRVETGNLAPMFEYIGSLLSGMEIGSQKLAKTWGSLVTTTQGAWQLLMNEAFGPAYDQIVQIGWQLLDIIYKNGQLTESGKLLAKVLSDAWGMISDVVKEFADDLEADPTKISKWTQAFIVGITNVTKMFFLLAEAILYVAEVVSDLESGWKNFNIMDIIPGTTNRSSGKMINFLTGDITDESVSGKGGEGNTKKAFTDRLKKMFEEIRRDFASGGLGNFDKTKLPDVFGIDVKENDIIQSLDKYQKAYLGFSKTIVDSYGSIWGKIVDYQSESLEKIRDMSSEMAKTTGIEEKALKYEKDLLAIRKEALNTLLEEKKLEYREYAVSLLPPLESAREKLKLEEEKEERKYNMPPYQKQFNIYADFVKMYNKSLINLGDTTNAAKDMLVKGSEVVGENIFEGCRTGAELLIEASKKIGNEIKIAAMPTPSLEGGTAGWGGYVQGSYPNDMKMAAAAIAKRYGLNPAIVGSLINAESGWNPNAISPKGAMGLGQLMPGTAASLGVTNPFDPIQNLEGSIKYFGEQVERFGDYTKALAAYNAGPENVAKYSGIPPFKETQDFVTKVLSGAKSFESTLISGGAALTAGNITLQPFYDAVTKLLTGAVESSNCGDAVAKAMNSTLIGEKFPYGGYDRGQLTSLANAHGAPVLNKKQITMGNLQRLGPGTAFYMGKPGDDHAEVTVVDKMNKLAIMSWKKSVHAYLKPLDEEYIKNLPENTIAANLFVKNRLPQTSIEGEKWDMTRGSLQADYDELSKKVDAYKKQYEPQVEAGKQQRWTERDIEEGLKKNELQKQYNELLATAYEGTGKEFEYQRNLIELEGESNRLTIQKNEFRDKILQGDAQALRVAQLISESEKRINLMYKERAATLERANVFATKAQEIYSALGSIPTEWMNKKDTESIFGMREKALGAQQLSERIKLEQDLDEYKRKGYSDEQIAIIRNTTLIKQQVEQYKLMLDLTKERLSMGGFGEGVQLWALNRLPDIKTRTSSFAGDLMKDVESTLGNGIMAVIKNKGGEGIEELSQQLLDDVIAKMVNYTVSSLFDMIAQTVSSTVSLTSAGSTAAMLLASGGQQAAQAMIQGATISKSIMSGGTGNISSLGSSSGDWTSIGGSFKGAYGNFGGSSGGSGGFFSNIFQGIGEFFNFFHNGGVVGSFVYAHNGLNLAPDEVPIIAQTGERVLSRSQNAAYEEGSKSDINITIQNNSKVQLQGSVQKTSNKEFLIMLDEANATLLNGGGKMSKAMEQRFNLSQSTVRR